jgi:hypothetical protein
MRRRQFAWWEDVLIALAVWLEVLLSRRNG